MWQKCPICNGTGVSQLGNNHTFMPGCPTCKGARIIDEITGKPPTEYLNQNEKQDSTKTTRQDEERSLANQVETLVGGRGTCNQMHGNTSLSPCCNSPYVTLHTWEYKECQKCGEQYSN